MRGESPPSFLPDAALSPVHIVRVGELAGLREGLEQGEEALEGGQGGDDCLLPVTCSTPCQHHHIDSKSVHGDMVSGTLTVSVYAVMADNHKPGSWK